MDKFIIEGGNKLKGEVKVSGAKNVAMKVILAGLLTDETLNIGNIPLISSVYGTCDIVKHLGVKVKINSDHTMQISGRDIDSYTVPLEVGGLYRTATMVIGPLLSRFGRAVVPNPGGCRLGKRPIGRHIDGLKAMGAKITYKEGYFKAEASELHGTKFRFDSNTHTGTETMILAAVKALGETVIENAAMEPEIDDLIRLLSLMGAKIKRIKPKTIVIEGVKKMSGAHYEIMPDRNEVVTFAAAAIASGGNIVVEGTQRKYLKSFLQSLDQARIDWEPLGEDRTRFYAATAVYSTKIQTAPYPGFMTDWQSSWAILMTQAQGKSVIHETVYEDRFGYVRELKKIGAKIEFYNPKVTNPRKFYNFNWNDRKANNFHSIKIYGPSVLHNGVMEVMDLRAGATLVLGALIASGKSVIYGIEHIDRGYEKIEERLRNLGANIKRVKGD